MLISLSSCKKDTSATDSNVSVEQLYFNGKIYTVNTRLPWAEAMLVRNGVISAIGSEVEVKKEASENTEMIDLQGRMVMPGIHDVHVHPLEAASDNFQFVLNEGETDPENYVSTIAQALNDNKNTDWILGWGFEIFTMLDAERAPIEILDEISATKPIAIMERTSHSVWVNSVALRMAGLDKNALNPTGGIIMKDDNGHPNGLLIDNAGNLVIDLAIATIPNGEQNDYDGLVDFALPELAKNGITSICDARTYWKRNHHITWQQLEEDKKLTVRVNLGLWLYPTENDATQISTLQSLYSNDPNSLLRINQIKLYSDGIVVNTTAAMQDDYVWDIFKMPRNNGLNYVTESRMANYISALEPIGFDFHIHAIGNRGVNEALNAIEQSSTGTGRHRLTHVEYVLESDYRRFNALNVTADAQVAGDFSQAQNWQDNDEITGEGLNNAIIPIKSLQQADARITLSSDWDVSTLNPFVGLQNAVTRVPQELSLAEAIRAYTIQAAYVMRQENKVGSLEEGKEADFIVLSQNLFETQPNLINQTEIVKTFLKGKLIYARD